MSNNRKNNFFMGKVCYLTVAVGMAAALVAAFLSTNTVQAGSPENVLRSATTAVTIGSCSWTPETGSLTIENLFLGHAALTINGVTYKSTQAINLAPGSYPYSWTAENGTIGNGSGMLTINACPIDLASASVIAGACHWTQVTGSLTPVSIILMHASLTINGLTYKTSKTIDLPPGSYPYSWTADNGYIGSGTGTLVIKDCQPITAEASVEVGACSWTQASGSLTPLTLKLDHAWLTINKVTYLKSQTIILPPGSYPYFWAALIGYSGSGSGTVVIKDCKPAQAKASVEIGACSWTQATGSLTPVKLELDHSVLTINKVTYSKSQNINLPPGNYPYSWMAENGYVGSGSGTAVIKDCKPAQAKASVEIGACSWTQVTGSLTPVKLELDHSVLTINKVTYSKSQNITLPPGSYPYTWTALGGYTGNGSGIAVIKDCTPGKARASVTAGACSWTQADRSQTPVMIELDHASLTIGGVTYASSQTINLPPATYPYTWKSLQGYIGDGSGSLVIADCTPGTAAASVAAGACSWSQAAGALSPISIALDHASLTINGVTYTASQTVDLPPGTYPYTWAAANGYIGDGDGSLVVGDCTPGTATALATAGACSWTQESGALSPISIALDHASLTINGVTYTASQTVDLPPGTYPYTWTALSGFLGNGSGTTVVGDCTPARANASVTAGACSWTQAAGSQTPVTLDLDHASITINNVTYSSPQTINLPAGSYPYTWTALSGYLGNGSGTVVVGACKPGDASASVTTGACHWTQGSGSLTPVTLGLDHASLTINGDTFTAAQVINLHPGSYPYNWTALSGYIGKGDGTLVVGDCTPGNASVSITKGACAWARSAGSLTPVTLDLNHASLTINGATYTVSQTINLPPGSFPYTWTALSGYIGNGSGTVVVGDCMPATSSALVTAAACTWTQEGGSLTPVTVTLDHASLTINAKTYTTSQTFNLPPGSFPYSWTADDGYIGNGSGTLVINDCTPGTASISLTVGACAWTQAAGSLTPVTLDLNHALLAINGMTYSKSQTINLPPGNYPYTWTAENGYIGSGSGPIVIGSCKPAKANASVTIGACTWSQSTGSLTPVSIALDHATLTINGLTYTSSQSINLPAGSYPYTWKADNGYTGNGNGTLAIKTCAPDPASASVTRGACTWTQAAGSLTSVSISLKHATLTVNGVNYTTSQTINLPPGSYPYSWTGESGYGGNGNGTLVVGDCLPKEPKASLSFGVCFWTQAAGSLTPVSFDLENASLTINNITYTSSQTINLPPGMYPYHWTGLGGSRAGAADTLNIRDCPPILIPISGVDKHWLSQSLPDSLSRLSLPGYVQTNPGLPADALSVPTDANPAAVYDERLPLTKRPDAQAPGLVPDRLVIPSINLDAPIIAVGFKQIQSGGRVFNEWLTPNQFAAGWHVTSALLGVPGNTVLNGHHNAYGMVFKDLVYLKAGAVIRVYSGSKEFHYQVIANMLLPERFEPMSTRLENARWIGLSSDERLTLVTCWPPDNNTYRVVIVATPLNTPQTNP